MAQKDIESDDSDDNRDITLDELNVRLRDNQEHDSDRLWIELLFFLLWFWAQGIFSLAWITLAVLRDYASSITQDTQRRVSRTATAGVRVAGGDSFSQDVALNEEVTATDANNTLPIMETTSTSSDQTGPGQNSMVGPNEMINDTTMAINEVQESTDSFSTLWSPGRDAMPLKQLNRPPDKKNDQLETKFGCSEAESQHYQSNDQNARNSKTQQRLDQSCHQTNTACRGNPETNEGITAEDNYLDNRPWRSPTERRESESTEGTNRDVEAQTDDTQTDDTTPAGTSQNPFTTSHSMYTMASTSEMTSSSSSSEMGTVSSMNVEHFPQTELRQTGIQESRLTDSDVQHGEENHSTLVFCRLCKHKVATYRSHFCGDCTVKKRSSKK